MYKIRLSTFRMKTCAALIGVVESTVPDRLAVSGSEAASMVAVWEKLGGTKDRMTTMLAPADPLTCAANLKDRKVLMIAAKRDEIVPPSCTTALWEAMDRPKIFWYDTTHYGAALIFPFALKHVVEHFGAK